MNIVRSEALEQEVYQKVRTYLESSGRTGFHVSDLLEPRQAYWKRIMPKPLTKKEMGFFIGGQGHHAVVEAVLGPAENREHKMVITVDGDDITGTADYTDKFMWEFKTSRKWKIPEEPPEQYVRQLQMYCAMDGILHGRIVIFYLTPGRKWDGKTATGPEFVCFEVTFTKKELAGALEYLRDMKRHLKDALEKKTHEGLPLCSQEWMCVYRDKKGTVEPNCQWYRECKPKGR